MENERERERERESVQVKLEKNCCKVHLQSKAQDEQKEEQQTALFLCTETRFELPAIEQCSTCTFWSAY